MATSPDEYVTGPFHVDHPLGHMLERDFDQGDVDQLVWDPACGRSGVDSLVCVFADCSVFSSTYIIYLRYHSTGTALTARVALNSRWPLPCSVTRNGQLGRWPRPLTTTGSASGARWSHDGIKPKFVAILISLFPFVMRAVWQGLHS
jgi:hypothetical protein